MTTMSIEREIKLALPASRVEAARALLAELSGQAGQPVALANLYFDTPDGGLARAGGALRLRRTPDGWLQTFKFGGGASGGVHSRHEWEMAVAGEALELDALLAACGDAQARALVRDAAATLVPLFHTHFTRTLWPLHWTGTLIEAALDIGEVQAEVDGALRRAPICEIELELKDAPNARAHVALDALADVIQQRLPGTTSEDVSKAERGYRLRSGQ